MIRTAYKFSLMVAIFSLFTLKVGAFPWVVQHGYTTCMTCHYSPSGGGALTNYGKFIAGELFGRWNDSSTALPWLRNPTVEDKFEKKFFSADIDWILGMQGRVVQTYFQKPLGPNIVRKYGYPRIMQFDLETGMSIGEFFAIMQTGFRGDAANVASGEKASDLNVRQYYVGARDITYAFRVGKFFPEFGIRYPNHNIPTRKFLVFNHDEEPQLIQYSRYFDQGDVNIGYMVGSKGTTLEDKKGLVGTLTYRTGHSRTGLSHLSVENESGSYTATSIYTAIGYLEKGYTLFEYSQSSSKAGATSAIKKNLSFLESGWEYTKGLFLYANYQSRNDVTNQNTVVNIPVGFKFYPYTHIEFNGELGKSYANSEDDGMYGLLMGHWYF